MFIKDKVSLKCQQEEPDTTAQQNLAEDSWCFLNVKPVMHIFTHELVAPGLCYLFTYISPTHHPFAT